MLYFNLIACINFHLIKSISVSVAEAFFLLNQLLSLISRAILLPKMQEHDRTQGDQQELCSYRAPHTGSICRIFFLHERRAGIYAPNRREYELHAICDTSPRITAHIVGLECNDGRQVGITAADSEEDTEVARTRI